MKVVSVVRTVRTAGRLATADVTAEVTDAVRESGVREGVACISSPHTTCCFRFCDGVESAPPPLAPASGVVPIRDGELVVGDDCRILLVELDKARERRWTLQIVGD